MFSTSYSSAQRSALQQFQTFTQTTERNAAKVLKANGWNLEQALDAYFRSTTNSAAAGAPDTNALNAIFDQFRQPDDPPDMMTIQGSLQYFQSLGVSVEDSTVLVLCEALKSPTMGELTREGFVDGWGWRGLGCDTIEKQRAKIPELQQSMANNEEHFKRVYLWTFGWARTEGQKALPLESAIEWWKLLLQNRFSHLDSWTAFLTDKKRNSIPKDTWNMLYDFVQLTNKDPYLETYDEEGAWPSVIDQYVKYYKEKNTQ